MLMERHPIQSQIDIDLNHSSTSFYLYHLEHIAIIFKFQYSLCEICQALQMVPAT